MALKVADDGVLDMKAKSNFNSNFLLDKKTEKLGVADGFENWVISASRKVDNIKTRAFELLMIYFNMNVQVNIGDRREPRGCWGQLWWGHLRIPNGQFLQGYFGIQQ